MTEIIVSVMILLALFTITTALIAWWIGSKVKSREASLIFFRRQMFLLPSLAVLLIIYMFIKTWLFPQIPIFLEVIVLLIVSLYVSAKVESHFAKVPREFSFEDEGLILTSVRHAFRFSTIKKIAVEQGSRISLTTEKNGRMRVLMIHITDDKKRKALVRWIREGVNRNKGNAKLVEREEKTKAS